MRHKNASLLLLVLAAVPGGLAQVSTPRPGWVLNAAHAVRPVFGFRGNYWLGPSLFKDVVSAAFSASGGMVKTGGELIVLDPAGRVSFRANASSGPAIFGFTRQGSPALIFLPAAKTLWRVSNRRLQAVPLDARALNGSVLSVASPDSRHALLLVQRDDGVWKVALSFDAGAVSQEERLAGVDAPALMEADGTLLHYAEGELALRPPNGAEQHLRVAFEAGSFAAMGQGWVVVFEKQGSRRFAWRTTAGQESADQLPEEAH